MQQRNRQKPKTRPVRLLLITLIVALALALPAGSLFLADAALGAQYADTYYAVLGLKYDRLRSVEEPKIVVVGGSATAFGVDEALVEQETGMPCVAFGLYAAFGLKCMLDLSLNGIGDGDVVVIAPEYSGQMFSDYVGYDALLQAAEKKKSLLFGLGLTYTGSVMKHYPEYLIRKKEVADTGGAEGAGVYTKEAFDEQGRMIFPREGNIMDRMVSEDNLPEIRPDIVTPAFLEMVNEYVRKARRKGAEVYFGFCPVNVKSVTLASDTDKEGFVRALEEGLDCALLSDLDQHIMDERYFYDSNFHMNDTGMVYNTVLLINDIKRMTGQQGAVKTHLPQPPEGAADAEVLTSGTLDGLQYDVTAEGVVITGLEETALAAEAIVVPAQIENSMVRRIESYAFANAKARTITLPESVTVLGGHLFENCSELTRVELLAEELPQVGDTLTAGAPEGLVIAVPANAYGTYLTDYFWARYARVLARIED
ncbi:MAG: leucine-rich repeat protein [Lachnospiraceae bacterium]|nr:leucine-rich repeat protein [Lachnospiraceae bacterium]